MKNSIEKLLTVDEVAGLLRVKPSVVEYWIYTRSIPYIKIGKQVLFDKEDLKEWIQKQKRGAISLDSARRLKEVM